MSEWWGYVTAQVTLIAGPGWEQRAWLGGLTVAAAALLVAIVLLVAGLLARGRS